MRLKQTAKQPTSVRLAPPTGKGHFPVQPWRPLRALMPTGCSPAIHFRRPQWDRPAPGHRSGTQRTTKSQGHIPQEHYGPHTAEATGTSPSRRPRPSMVTLTMRGKGSHSVNKLFSRLGGLMYQNGHQSIGNRPSSCSSRSTWTSLRWLGPLKTSRSAGTPCRSWSSLRGSGPFLSTWDAINPSFEETWTGRQCEVSNTTWNR